MPWRKTSGSYNTATGATALNDNTSGNFNTAAGFWSMLSNTTGGSNTADGYYALKDSQTGGFNTDIGASALEKNISGNNNVAVGGFALFKTNLTNNTAVGTNALFNSTGSDNIALGLAAGVNLTAGSNNIDIGNRGAAADIRKIRIGTNGTHTNAYIAGINGVTVPSGVNVLIDSSGHLGTTTSSARYKEAIQPMDKASEVIHALQPVTFRYKKELDPDGIPQFGLVAEEVEKVHPDLVARDEQGKPYTVRYETVDAMLLNEFLKEHRKVETLEAIVTRQQSINAEQQEIQGLTASLKEQANQIQKVSAQLQVSKAAAQLVAGKH